MGLVYLPTFTVKINHSWIGKYTSSMDPLGWIAHFSPTSRQSAKVDTTTVLDGVCGFSGRFTSIQMSRFNLYIMNLQICDIQI